METFRSTFLVEKPPFGLAYDDRLLLVGSCFTENIGARLAAAKFQTRVNPFGIVYNPVSIARCLERLLSARPFGADELTQHAGLWHSWEHHGAFAGADRAAVLERLNDAYRQSAAFLSTANRLLLTLGTASVFELRDGGEVVANCHRAPAELFTERRLGVAETSAVLGDVLLRLHAKNPDLRVVLTVSPIRHLRRGPVANQQSKAVLVLACAELCERLPFVYYFPAYELLLDDLRDYRFYESDWTHPNRLAENYIWETFAEAFFSPETRALLAQIDKMRAAMEHRPFHPDSEAHRDFARRQLAFLAELQATGLDFSAETAYFQQFAGSV